MVTEASEKALDGLRDLSLLKWYVIPLLAIVLYIYFTEVKKARETGDWNPIYAGLTLFCLDFINETWNGIVFAVTQHSAFWTTPGETGFRVTVGWNIEIIFMFLIAGIIFYNSLPKDPKEKMFGLPARWVLAVGFAVFCVFVECILNMGGRLVWEYPWWNLSITGIWLIFFIGYLPFFAGVNLVTGMKNDKSKKIAIAVIFCVPLIINIVCLGILGMVY